MILANYLLKIDGKRDLFLIVLRRLLACADDWRH